MVFSQKKRGGKEERDERVAGVVVVGGTGFFCQGKNHKKTLQGVKYLPTKTINFKILRR